MEYDWTEVALLGMRPEQDTVADPYNGNPKMPASWVAEELYGRFYDLPAGIALILKAGVNTGDGDRAFAPIGARMGDFARHEAVSAERGIVIHYVYDAPDPDKPGALMSARGASQPARSSAAIVYQGEIYDLRPSWSWMTEAPVYGVPFGAKHFSAFIELPADFPLRPDGYRQFLRHADNLQKQIEAREFAPVVMRNRPEWMLELLRNFAPDAKHTDVVRDEMGDMFKSLQVKRRFWPVDPQGRTWPKPEGPWDGKHEYEVSPQIIPLRDIADIRERGIEGKAARFYPETHQVFINTTYGAFNDLRQKLEQEFAAAEDQERMRRAALTVTERIVIRSICRKLVFALSKRDSWDRWGMDAATSMHCLTLAADDQEGVYARARQDVANMLGAEAVDRTRAANVASAGTKFAAAMAELLAASGAQKHVLEVKLTQ